MLWLCIDLPELALEVFTRVQDSAAPFVVIEGLGREQRVLCANAAALRSGLVVGMPLGGALSLLHTLQVRPRDCAAEHAALTALAAWAGQFTSMVSLVPPQALLLEVQGSLNLFGGLAPLWQRVAQGVAELGYRAQLALAPTPLAATWLARAGEVACITDARELQRALAPLLLSVLDVSEAQRAFFQSLGLRTLGECLRLPRAGVTRRVGKDWLLCCDRALGKVADPRSGYVAPARFMRRVQFPAPVDNIEALLFPLQRLLQELQGALRARNAVVQGLSLQLHHAQSVSEMSLTLVSPARDAAHLLMLFRERFERFALPAPVEDLTLRTARVQACVERNLDLFSGSTTPQEQSAKLLERLQARLGATAIKGVMHVAEHRPEYAWQAVAPLLKSAEQTTAVNAARRPLWLLPQPQPLEVHDGRLYFDGILHLQRDRERVHSGWWDEHEVTRDYFIATNAAGTQLWVFRELQDGGRWMMHGVFA